MSLEFGQNQELTTSNALVMASHFLAEKGENWEAGTAGKKLDQSNKNKNMIEKEKETLVSFYVKGHNTW